MAKVELNTKAPEFTLLDFSGNSVSLSDFYDRKNVLDGFQSWFFLTILPKAYGAVASGL